MNTTRFEELTAAYLSGNIASAEREELMHWVEGAPENRAFFDQAISLWGMTAQYEQPAFGRQREAAWQRIEARLGAVGAAPAAGERPSPSRLRFLGNTRWWAAAAAGLLLFALGWWYLYTPDTIALATAAGERRELDLPDGTKVWLNENSSISYRSSDGERTVDFSGEAFFEVAKDSLRPFRIVTLRSVTTVLGTAFNLRAYPEEPIVEVAVKEGRVALARSSAAAKKPAAQADDRGKEEELSTILKQGETGILYPEVDSLTVVEDVNANVDAWKEQRLVFRHEKLSTVLPILERYFNMEFIPTDPGLLNCHFHGDYLAPDLSVMLQALLYTMNITAEQVDGKVILSGTPCSQ